MIFGRGYRVREVELAQRLARRTQLFALDRTKAMTGQRPTLGDRLRLRVDLLRSPFELLEDGPLARFTMPVAAGTGPLLNELAAAWNETRLREARRRFECTQVYLSSPFFFMPPRERAYRLHFDVIDNFHDQWPHTRVGRARREFHREQLRRADSVSASSLQLCDYVQRLADRPAVYIPNGAPLAEMRAVPRAEADAIRERYGLQGRFVVGFIGNHTMPFYGMERLVRGFVEARKKRPELALLVVGPDGERALMYCSGEADGVFITGPVPVERVAAYFHACDAGAHPYDPRPQTHDAMALNVIEFSACNKPVLSNPLTEFQRLALPNVRFTDGAAIRDWAAALADPASFAAFDEDALQRALQPFDWDRSAELLAGAMGLPGSTPPPVPPPDTRLHGVVQFTRRPLPGYHSIEKLFAAVRGAMRPKADVRVEECPDVSRAVLPRLRNLRWAKRAAGKVNHIVGDVHYLALSLPGARTLLTVHDCVALHRGSALKRAVLRKLYFQWPVARAAVVSTISQATKAELIRVTGCDPAKVRVIPNCVAPEFQHTPREFDAERPTLLLVGALPHKNLERTLEALRGMLCRLRVIGRLTSQQEALLQGFEYVNEYDLTTRQMVAAYRDCDLLVFASLYEGFGMPILEAQASGRAVVTSNLSSMPEVAGDGACLVDPNDIESIRAGVRRVIQDADYRAGLIAEGQRNVEQYRPERIAALYLDVYRELLR
jgi:glycosyltransferase involved in cell wall biosynthesis